MTRITSYCQKMVYFLMIVENLGLYFRAVVLILCSPKEPKERKIDLAGGSIRLITCPKFFIWLTQRGKL